MTLRHIIRPMKYRRKVQPNAAILAMMEGKEEARTLWELSDNVVRRCLNAWALLPQDLQYTAFLMAKSEV